MEYNKIYTVKARKGVAINLELKEKIEIINTHGSQCVDTWGFNSQNYDEFMSMEHTRATLDKMMPDVGEAFLTNCRRPILTIVNDTSPGVHDTLNAACDIYRYNLLGHKGYHDNCTDNLKNSLKQLGVEKKFTPCPFNLFSNRPWSESKKLYKKPPLCKPGDSFTMCAEMDCIVVLSSCPQDMNQTNGADQTPKEFNYKILP